MLIPAINTSPEGMGDVGVIAEQVHRTIICAKINAEISPVRGDGQGERI